MWKYGKSRRDLTISVVDGSIHLSKVLLITLKLQGFTHRNLVQVFHQDSQSEKNEESSTKLSLGSSFRFQHDNDLKHTAKIVKLWLLYNIQNQLHTPPQSPDLNPIERLWDLRERKIRQHNISRKDTLKSVFKDEWEEISAEETTKLVNSMLKRLQEVHERRGYPYSY
ncbi:transposable element Tcb1 transposase [Trichonephila clavipes]|uniref:Transposable element Tcb1 transposase n=1 Tax=Trichonephila clavipes TaxID=2585209 RepID=A0A8X6SLX2_TRICX|nr:transposable element Tcb1 transposase [Trichonephila clavipes]